MTDSPTLSPNLRRAAAFLEAMGVLLGGNLIHRAVADPLGLARSRDLIAGLTPGVQPDFFHLAGITALEQTLKYTILFGLAFLIGRWHRRRPATSYGLTTGGCSWGSLVGIGILLWAATSLLPNLLAVLGRFVDLGAGAEHWVVFDYRWDLGFWFFMAASSFILIPVCEELFARGYFQTRLSEDFGPAGGILIAAGVFSFSHTQYYRLSMLSLGTLLGVLIFALLAGYVFHRTRSLLPVVVAHAIGNVPVKEALVPGLLVLAVLLLAVHRRGVIGWAGDFLRLLREDPSPGATLLGLLGVAVFVAVLAISPSVVLIFAVGLVPALVLEGMERRISRAAKDGPDRESRSGYAPGEPDGLWTGQAR
jgi:membrane protease YdiL (CAAX protease family)